MSTSDFPTDRPPRDFRLCSSRSRGKPKGEPSDSLLQARHPARPTAPKIQLFTGSATWRCVERAKAISYSRTKKSKS